MKYKSQLLGCEYFLSQHLFLGLQLNYFSHPPSSWLRPFTSFLRWSSSDAHHFQIFVLYKPLTCSASNVYSPEVDVNFQVCFGFHQNLRSLIYAWRRVFHELNNYPEVYVINFCCIKSLTFGGPFVLAAWVHACLFTQLYLTLGNPMDYSPLGSFVHGIFQVRILEWVVISSSRGDLPSLHLLHLLQCR